MTYLYENVHLHKTAKPLWSPNSGRTLTMLKQNKTLIDVWFFLSDSLSHWYVWTALKMFHDFCFCYMLYMCTSNDFMWNVSERSYYFAIICLLVNVTHKSATWLPQTSKWLWWAMACCNAQRTSSFKYCGDWSNMWKWRCDWINHIDYMLLNKKNSQGLICVNYPDITNSYWYSIIFICFNIYLYIFPYTLNIFWNTIWWKCTKLNQHWGA